MKEYSKQELIDFINSQPDSRPVNFNESNSYGDCGCLLVHFFKERAKLGNFSVGYSMASDGGGEIYGFKDDIRIGNFISHCIIKGFTKYKKVKELAATML